jgi:hypothetical protein
MAGRATWPLRNTAKLLLTAITQVYGQRLPQAFSGERAGIIQNRGASCLRREVDSTAGRASHARPRRAARAPYIAAFNPNRAAGPAGQGSKKAFPHNRVAVPVAVSLQRLRQACSPATYLTFVSAGSGAERMPSPGGRARRTVAGRCRSSGFSRRQPAW